MSKKNIITNKYGLINTSFSGADIVATITPKGGKPVVFGEVQTISYSIYRPTTPVYALGCVGAKGFTQGNRTIAGSIIFTVFDRHVLKNAVDAVEGTKGMSGAAKEELKQRKRNMRGDEMPIFNINISFMNEFGNGSTLDIIGVKIITEGQTMSIEDMVTENTMQYMAMDIDLMRANGLDG